MQKSNEFVCAACRTRTHDNLGASLFVRAARRNRTPAYMGLRLGGGRLCLTVYMVQMLTIKVKSNYQIRTIHKKVTIKFGLKTKTQTQSLEVIQYHTTYYTQESNYQIRANNLSCLAVRLKLSIKHGEPSPALRCTATASCRQVADCFHTSTVALSATTTSRES